MKMTPKQSIAILEIHKDNLTSAKTYEEFREAQCKYIDTLIARYQAEDTEQQALSKYVEWSVKWVERVIEEVKKDK